MKERKGYKTYYNQYKIEFNILIAVLILVIIAFIVYFIWFNDQTEENILGLSCTTEEITSVINYDLETCMYEDDFETYTTKYVYLKNTEKPARDFNSQQEQSKRDLIKKATYTNFYEKKLLNAKAQEIEIIVNDDLITFITLDAWQSYYEDDIYDNAKTVVFNDKYELVSADEILEKAGIENARTYNSKFRREMILLIQNVYGYSYFEKEYDAPQLDKAVEGANFSKLENLYLENNQVTFIYDILPGNYEPARYYKFVLSEDAIKATMYKNKVY